MRQGQLPYPPVNFGLSEKVKKSVCRKMFVSYAKFATKKFSLWENFEIKLKF